MKNSRFLASGLPTNAQTQEIKQPRWYLVAHRIMCFDMLEAYSYNTAPPSEYAHLHKGEGNNIYARDCWYLIGWWKRGWGEQWFNYHLKEQTGIGRLQGDIWTLIVQNKKAARFADHTLQWCKFTFAQKPFEYCWVISVRVALCKTLQTGRW